MEWIDVNKNLPPEGEYIVKTLSIYGKFFKKENALKCKIHYNEKGEHSWSCNNQRVTYWLKE